MSSTSKPVTFKDVIKSKPSNSAALNSHLSRVYIVDKSEAVPKLETFRPDVKALLSFYQSPLVIPKFELDKGLCRLYLLDEFPILLTIKKKIL